MNKPIVRDVLFLGQKSEPATKADMQVAIDLQDTLKANRAGCVGLAANMIGVKKNIIIVNMGPVDYTLREHRSRILRYAMEEADNQIIWLACTDLSA